MRDVVIVSAVRTPIGSFNGALGSVPAARLGAAAIREAVRRAGLDGAEVDEVLMGCVLPAGQGQAPARQAAIYAGLPTSVPCTTVNKVCGSGLKTVTMGAQAIMTGDADIVVAGGMENMDLAPYALPKARGGYRMGNGEIVDLMVNDGLWDVYNNFHMGVAAEKCSAEYNYGREAQDAFAKESYRRSTDAIARGLFKDEIVAVEVPQGKGDPLVFDTDEEPGRGKPDKMPSLRPAFKKDGVVTAANASSINDGAAAVVLMAADVAAQRGLTPMGRLVAHAMHAQAPEWFTTAPVKAIEKALQRASLSAADIDVWEINEAFSCVTMAAIDQFGIDTAKVNVRGGAVSLGHPIGASGARVLVTLLYAMRDQDAKRGLATLCIGGGEAIAAIVER
jgi:acetyl-CoA C-acetyltransferase